MTRLLALAIVVLALALAGCGGGDDKKTDSNAKPAAGGGGEVKVAIKDIKFLPHTVSAKVGQKIVWTNDDPVSHNVTPAAGGAEFESGTLSSGATFSFTPKKAGTINYVCTIHPGQTGTIKVSG
jgi:plastocyanin